MNTTKKRRTCPSNCIPRSAKKTAKPKGIRKTNLRDAGKVVYVSSGNGTPETPGMIKKKFAGSNVNYFVKRSATKAKSKSTGTRTKKTAGLARRKRA